MTNLSRLGERGINGVAFDIEPLTRELKAYGEIEAADWLAGIDERTHDQVSRLAMKYLVAERIMVDKAICLAAVETHEGRFRPLRRKRRYYGKSVQSPR